MKAALNLLKGGKYNIIHLKPQSVYYNRWWSYNRSFTVKVGKTPEEQAANDSPRPQKEAPISTAFPKPLNNFPESTPKSNEQDNSSPQNPSSTTHATQQVKLAQVAGKGPMDESTEKLDLATMKLSPEQQQVLDLAKAGKSIFFTGSAGTGKTIVLRLIIQQLKAQKKKVAVTASTGVAAEQIEGSTLHHFAGIGVPSRLEDFDKILRSRKLKARWKALDVLVIDELSLISAEFFDCLEAIVTKLRKKPKFGGIQLILCGLPPIFDRVPTPEQIQQQETAFGSKPFFNKSFCFQSTAWRQLGLTQMTLSQVFRQSEEKFVRILNEIRVGKVSSESIKMLNSCQKKLRPIQGIETTRLFPLNRDVNAINAFRLFRLPGQSVQYEAMDRVEVEGTEEEKPSTEQARKQLLSNPFFYAGQAVKLLELKVGAQVILIKNLDTKVGEALVNGSRGVVVKFKSTAEVQEELERSGSNADNRKKTWLEYTVNKSKDWPVVRFTNGIEKTLLPDVFKSEVCGVGTCKRWQIPLRLSWALTIHKCQGLTLDRAEISLANVFECGHAYVALSRVRSLDGLELKGGFPPDCVLVNEKVLQFYGYLPKPKEEQEQLPQEEEEEEQLTLKPKQAKDKSEKSSKKSTDSDQQSKKKRKKAEDSDIVVKTTTSNKRRKLHDSKSKKTTAKEPSKKAKKIDTKKKTKDAAKSTDKKQKKTVDTKSKTAQTKTKTVDTKAKTTETHKTVDSKTKTETKAKGETKGTTAATKTQDKKSEDSSTSKANSGKSKKYYPPIEESEYFPFAKRMRKSVVDFQTTIAKAKKNAKKQATDYKPPSKKPSDQKEGQRKAKDYQIPKTAHSTKTTKAKTEKHEKEDKKTKKEDNKEANKKEEKQKPSKHDHDKQKDSTSTSKTEEKKKRVPVDYKPPPPSKPTNQATTATTRRMSLDSMAKPSSAPSTGRASVDQLLKGSKSSLAESSASTTAKRRASVDFQLGRTVKTDKVPPSSEESKVGKRQTIDFQIPKFGTKVATDTTSTTTTTTETKVKKWVDFIIKKTPTDTPSTQHLDKLAAPKNTKPSS